MKSAKKEKVTNHKSQKIIFKQNNKTKGGLLMKRITALVIGLLLIVVSGCGGDGTPATTKGFTLTATNVTITKISLNAIETQKSSSTSDSTSLISIKRDEGFDEAITFTFEGLPFGVSAEFLANQVTGDNTRLKFSVGLTAGLRTTKITVKGRAANGAKAEVKFDLTVKKQEPPQVVTIPDSNLAKLIREKLGLVANQDVTTTHMESLISLDSRHNESTASARKIANLEGLQYAINLQTLDLNYNKISNITVLRGLKKLRELYLSWNNINDITPLKTVNSLQILHLGWNAIADLRPLKDMTQLHTLIMFNNRISDVTPLRNLTNLQRLALDTNIIKNIEPLKALTKLRELSLIQNGIKDISALKSLTNLINLYFRDNSIADINPIKDLTNLESLGLSNNNISDMNPLRLLSKLKFLGLAHNNINDLTVLTYLKNLENVALRGNRITDIIALKDLQRLRYVGLSGNQITDIEPLSSNFNGLIGRDDEVDISYNCLDINSGVDKANIRRLIDRGVKVTFEPQRSDGCN